MKPHDDTPQEAARAIASFLRHMPPGPLAELRRMTEEAPAPQFWRLAARYPGTIGRRSRQHEWIAIVRILAILADKGEPAGRSPLHDSSRALGEVLCDGGDPNWPGQTVQSPRPAFSERRLAQLMATRGTQRATQLERAARAIASRRVPGSGVNVVDIAYAVLRPHVTQPMAKAYYDRLDRAEQGSQQSKKGTDS